ncbi:MAG: exonuclease domain-containing protein [Kiritimatiellae bacterium]|nr:exonuclease domain-containing protein [Kiritimatiellia bacterium]
MSEPDPRTTAYVWFDTEYSTLELESAVLLQVAAVVTDADLQRIFPPEDDLRLHIKLAEGTTLSPWVEEHLQDLVAACRSEDAVDLSEADARLAELVGRVPKAGNEMTYRPVLAGNSVHCDWWLARKFLPRFIAQLHYRHLDVTAVKLQWQDLHAGPEFAKDGPEELLAYLPGPKELLEGKPHDAYYDVLASIAELNYYRQQFFKK